MLDMIRASCAVLVMAFPLLSQVSSAATGSVASDTQTLTWLKSGDYAALDRYIADLQRSYELGQLSDQQLYQGFRRLYEDDVANARYFDQWVRAYPKSFAAHVARGAYYYRMAWAARGEEFIKDTPPERLKRMHDYLALSRPELLDSLKLTAKPYLSTLYLLNVALLDGPRDAHRKWLDLGTSIDPNNSLLRKRYMVSLQPRWGGSFDEMRAFIAECAQQKVPASTMAALKLNLASELAEAAAQTASPAEMLPRWNDVLQLSQAAGEPPPPRALRALVGYARSAWDLNRRADADRMLAKLAQVDVNDAWSLSQMGAIYVREQRMAEGWTVLKKAAMLNDAWAQLAVGETLIHGCPEINLPPDWHAALVWIQRSAYQGFAEAITILSWVIVLVLLCLLGLFFAALWLVRRTSKGIEAMDKVSGVDSPSQASPARAPEQLRFTGSGAEYFGIWIVNWLLTIVTLGIYSAWAKVRRLQYFYRHTELAGSSFDFHGSPIRILIGRAIALGMVISYKYSVRLHSPLTLVIVVGLAVVMPWLLRNSFRFRLYNASWRGTRFHFRGGAAGAYRVFLLNGFLALITVYGMAPFMHQRVKAYQHDNSWFGRTRFSFHARAGQFYLIYLLWLVAIVIFVILIGVAGIAGPLTALFHMQKQGGHADPRAIFHILLILYGALILIGATVGSTFHALITNLIWNNTRLGEHRFECDMPPLVLIWITFSNFVLAVLTLGLFIPWAMVRLARFQLAYMRLLPASDLQEFVAAEPETIGAVGEEAATMFDFDISL
jgi:uncharacterized membrane protein YjgN (DUF898 family)